MPLIELDRSEARTRFHRAPFAMRHGLAGHDLFTLPRLVELAKSMPRDRIEYNSGKLEPGIRPEDVPGIAMPAEDVIRRIENADAWLVIKGVEHDPAYRALLHEFLTEVALDPGRCRAHSLSLAALGAHRLKLVRVDGDDLEDSHRPPAQQGPPDQRHAAPLWAAASLARPV